MKTELKLRTSHDNFDSRKSHTGYGFTGMNRKDTL